MNQNTSPSSTTKERIKVEFLKQLNLTSYSEIRIKDIASVLDMSRQNFYKYYHSKQEILADITGDLFASAEALIESLPPDVEFTQDVFTDLFWEVAVNNRQILMLMHNREADEQVFQLVRSAVVRLFGRLARKNDIVIKDHDYFELLVQSTTGTFFYGLKSWASPESDVSLDKVKQWFKSVLDESVLDRLRLCG